MDSSPLPLHQKAAFGVGHVLNDLCAAMWFSYLLVFLHNVLQFSNILSGYLMLLGQIVDAICTPFVGYESDHTNGCGNYGKRKSWHLVGSISVACSFPFFFMQCISCADADDWAKFIYYAPFVVIFQFGWAATQISHLALIPQLASCESARVELNSIRYAMTVISSIAVYGIAAGILGPSAGDSTLCKDDLDLFKTLALIVVGIGSLFSIIFHIGTKETRPRIQSMQEEEALPPSAASKDDNCEITVLPSVESPMMKWYQWLKEVQFYQVAGIYMCTRLIVNLSQIYIPMFLVHSLKLGKVFIAVVPLTVFISGFLSSISMKMLNRIIGRKGVYVLGLFFIIGACIWFWFLHYLPKGLLVMVFGPAVLLGIGGSCILVTSLSMTADLIGNRTYGGAFVYGAMSFTDKLSNGLAVVLIQHFHPCKGGVPCCPACVWYYRDCMVFIPGGIAILAFFILLSLIPQKLGQLRQDAPQPIANGERRPLLSSQQTPSAIST